MTNLTITIDDELLERAEVRARERRTSVEAVLRECLVALAGSENLEGAVSALLDLSRRATSGRGSRRWKRDDVHER